MNTSCELFNESFINKEKKSEKIENNLFLPYPQDGISCISISSSDSEDECNCITSLNLNNTSDKDQDVEVLKIVPYVNENIFLGKEKINNKTSRNKEKVILQDHSGVQKQVASIIPTKIIKQFDTQLHKQSPSTSIKITSRSQISQLKPEIFKLGSKTSNVFKQTSCISDLYITKYDNHYFDGIGQSEKEALEKLFNCLNYQQNLDENGNQHLQMICDKLFRITLKQHQLEGLIWMLKREEMSSREETSSGTGGILADDMGLGKTLTSLALIMVSNYFKRHKINSLAELTIITKSHNTSCDSNEGFLTSKNLPHLYPSSSIDSLSIKCKPTLVVCPASIIHQWESECRKYCTFPPPKILVYHGASRSKRIYHITNHDIVITTYNLIANEQSNAPLGVISSIEWERIILDEAHYIKNPAAQTSKAICALFATYRWTLTGTPIHNTLNDLYALVKFLRFQPFSNHRNHNVWKTCFGVNSSTNYSSSRINLPPQLRAKNESTSKLVGALNETETNFVSPLERSKQLRLALLLKVICLRRMKDQKDEIGQALIELPPRYFKTYCIQLNTIEKQIYTKVLALTRGIFEKMLASGQNRTFSILVHLLRLRQACCHPALLKRAIQAMDIKLERGGASGKVDLMSINEQNEGDKFMRDLEQKFTAILISPEEKNLSFQQLKLPTISQDFVEAMSPDSFPFEFSSNLFSKSYISTKIQSLINLICSILEHTDKAPEDSTSFHENAPRLPHKCIIVSQWTTFLDIIQHHLLTTDLSSSVTNDKSFPKLKAPRFRPNEIVKIYGSTPALTRSHIVDIFNDLAPTSASNTAKHLCNKSIITLKPRILLLSLTAGGVGLNLTGGNHIIFVDNHWNPAHEKQASDRIYRMGQVRPVTVHRFICSATIEERIESLQTEKLRLANETLQNSHSGGKLPIYNQRCGTDENVSHITRENINEINYQKKIEKPINNLGIEDIRKLLF